MTSFIPALRPHRSARTALAPQARTKPSTVMNKATKEMTKAIKRTPAYIKPQTTKEMTKAIKRMPAYIKPKYDKSATQTFLLEPAFTRRREVFVGRLAMTGFFAALVGELFTGKGAIGQLALETQLPPMMIKALVAGIVIFNAAVALNPKGTTFSPQNVADVRKRPLGALQRPSISAIGSPTRFLGISDKFGFTKKNELFVGRVAMLGFAAELIGELATGGKGPLGQLGFSMPMFQQLGFYGLAGWSLFFLAAAVGSGTFPGQPEAEEEIY